ncbi:MAG: polyhydroxyalkanoate synthase [Myxococcota bacterium]|jgi:polyhydroxyalkanoate synthase
MLQRVIAVSRTIQSVPRVQIGCTPHAILHRQHETALRYFAPRGEVRRKPIFISMPLINTWSIFDLMPGRSVIEALIEAGAPVYVMDWGHPGPEAASRPLSKVIDDMMVRAIKRATRHARQQGFLTASTLPDAIGYCVGGSFLSVTLARHRGLIGRVVFLAAPIDFHASGRLSLWADPETFPLDDIVDNLGNFPRALMATSFAWLRPAGQVSKWKTLWERGEDEGFTALWAAMEKWSSDGVDFPGECYREYVRQCYFNNALITGGWMLNGTPVDLSAATIPALVIAASTDHICPPEAAFGLAKSWGGPVETTTLRGGHVGICLSSRLPSTLLGWLT